MTDTNTPAATLAEQIKQQLTEGREKINAQLSTLLSKQEQDMEKVRAKYADQVSALQAELAEADQVLSNFSGGRKRATNQGSGGRGRPRGSGKRADEAVEIIKAQPGVTIPEIAERMGIGPNYLYRVLPGLVDAGRVWKDGNGWHPAHQPNA